MALTGQRVLTTPGTPAWMNPAGKPIASSGTLLKSTIPVWQAEALSGNKLTNPLRRDGVVPLPVKLVSRDSHRRQSVVSDLDPSRVVTRIKPRSDLQSGRGRHLTDQVDHHRS